MVRHPDTGKYRRTRLFVFTLGYSRKSVRLLTFASSTRRWAELHEETFRRLGGAVRVVILDNLREGVLTPDIYDPTLNPLYRDVLAHYGAVALPCRVGDPDRKGKVESAIGHTQAALKGLRFETLAEAQAYLDRWDARWADTRIHGTTKRQVAAMFAEERPALRPLPVEPFRYYRFGTRTVHLDGCVEVEYAYYAAAARAGSAATVAVQWDGVHVRLLHPTTGALLREHRRQRPGRAMRSTPRTSRRAPRPPRWRCSRGPPAPAPTSAPSARPSIAGTGRPACAGSSASSPWSRNTAPPPSTTPAPRRWSCGVTDYRFVRRYLERHPAAPLTLRQVDPLIRDLTHYREVIARKTQEVPT